jgi:murein DD-endopeptidase MepM/ murein hydrolase activator NlpD
MKSLLLFLAGMLVGANLVYFLVARGHRDSAPAGAPSRDAATAAGAAPVSVASPVAPEEAPPPATPALPARNLADSATPPAGALLLPVAGIEASQLTDTFNQTRDGTRRHEALDIMAPRGTPVLAASDGIVAKLFTSVPGGLTIYEFDPTRTYAYYYAHLDRYADGLAEGKALHRGDVIGYVGSTGNAREDAPHLHFAIFLLGPEKQWWKGTAINPYPLLAKQSQGQ